MLCIYVVISLCLVGMEAVWKAPEYSSSYASQLSNRSSCTGEHVMIRTSQDPGEYMIKRFHRLASMLREDQELMFAVDNSNAYASNQGQASSSKMAELDKLSNGNVYFFTSEDMLKAYPTLASMPSFEDRGKGLAWGYHFESFSVVKMMYEKRHNKAWDKCGIWIVEDDLGYTGDWSEMLDSWVIFRREIRADLVSLRAHKVSAHELGMCELKRIASPSFKERYPIFWHHDSYLQFFGRQFFLMLEASSRAGEHAFSEVQVPTACHQKLYGGCMHKDIPVKILGEDGYFTYPQNFTHTEAEMKDRYEKFLGKEEWLLHPMKF